MPGKAKAPKYVGRMRYVLAANVRAAMEFRFPTSTNKPKALAKASGVTLSTVQRILEPTVGATVDSLEQLADALGFSVYQLLSVNFNVRNPVVFIGASQQREHDLAMKMAQEKGLIYHGQPPKPKQARRR